MLKLTLAIFVVWQLAVILFQCSAEFRQKLGAWPFYLCGLLPTWRMFGPQPVDGDYLLYYRTAANRANPAQPQTAAASFTPWRLLDADQKPHPLLALFYNPRANLVKALREICQEAAKADSPNNVYYQLLLHELIRELKRHPEPSPTEAHEPKHTLEPNQPRQPKKPPEPKLLQFQICWRTPTSLTPIFSSHVHPY